MIGEIGTGSSFRGLNHYLLHGSAETGPREPTWAELRNLAVRDPGPGLPGDAGRPPARITAPPSRSSTSSSRRPRRTSSSREQWSALADRVLSGLGLDEHQALVVHHSDTDVPHLHLAVNRIHPERLTAWETWRSKTRLETILRKVERDWGLRRVEGRLLRERSRAETPRRRPLARSGPRPATGPPSPSSWPGARP